MRNIATFKLSQHEPIHWQIQCVIITLRFDLVLFGPSLSSPMHTVRISSPQPPVCGTSGCGQSVMESVINRDEQVI